MHVCQPCRAAYIALNAERIWRVVAGNFRTAIADGNSQITDSDQ
jgi:hypothetical protein